jgi:beta-lactamase regulating signal transducer with metallopeptidase domain
MPASTLSVLLEAALKGAAIFLIAALAMPFLRRRSAAVRHAAWSFAVSAQLVLPLLAAVAPSWGTRLADRPQWVADAFTLPAGRPGAAAPGTVPAGARNAAAAPHPAEPNGRPGKLLHTLTAVWLAGAGLVLLHLAVGTAGVWRLAARGRRVLDAAWLGMAHELAERIGISRPLTLLRGESLAMPVTWGIVYPVVLLPAEAESWDAERRRYVLVHEMAHIRRFDALTHLVGQVALAIFWFDPLVWLAVSRIRAEREHACDDYVLRTGTQPSRYANDLLTMVRTIGLPDRRSTPPAFAALSMARRSEFEGRMMAILEDDAPRAPLSGRGIVGGAASAAVLALALAGFRPLAPRDAAMPAPGARPAPPPAGPSASASVPSPVTPAPQAESGSVDTVPASVRPIGGEVAAGGPSPVSAGAQADRGSLDSVLAALRGDGNKAAILAEYARSGDDARLSAAMRAVPSRARDQDKSLVLAHAAPGALGGGDVRLRDAFFAALESIRRDEDRTLVLVHAAANGKGSRAVTALVLRATARMKSPGAATVLMNVAQRHLVTSDSLRALYLQVANSLGSEDDRQRSLTALLLAPPAQPPVSP